MQSRTEESDVRSSIYGSDKEAVMGAFKAVVVEKGEGGQSVSIRDFDENDLVEGDVTVRVRHSTLNYKDGLAHWQGARGAPLSDDPGIDFAGVIPRALTVRSEAALGGQGLAIWWQT